MAVLALALPLGPASAQDATAARFDALKQLAGTWRIAGEPTPLRIRFWLTAGGTVLAESWERAGRPHSLTLYHRDGAALIATHYCPQGNQPRLALQPGSTPTRLRFAFRDATDLDHSRESYLVALSFDLSNPAAPVRRETYRRQGTDEPSELTLVREGGPT